MGLGCLDRLAGGVFGLLQGVVLVTLVHPGDCGVLSGGALARGCQAAQVFFGVCHLSTHVSPAELAERVREGLQSLEQRFA